MALPERPYHHGNLPRALLEATGALVAEVGPFSWSLREVARRAGVSHAAPAHHFGDKSGLLRALAIEGFTRFSLALREGAAEGTDAESALAAQGRAYVRFATENRGHFDVMFRCDLFDVDDQFLEVSATAYAELLAVAAAMVAQYPHLDADTVALTCWATAHGVANLAIGGMLDDQLPVDALSAIIDQTMTGFRGPSRALR